MILFGALKDPSAEHEFAGGRSNNRNSFSTRGKRLRTSGTMLEKQDYIRPNYKEGLYKVLRLPKTLIIQGNIFVLEKNSKEVNNS